MVSAPKPPYTILSLLQIMSILRDKETGCPWDIEQDFKSIAPCTLEEAYEVADAIDRNHMDDLSEELGDLLLQVVFHAQMAKELGNFTFDDVVTKICNKLVSRHPHVFAEGNAENADDVMGIWQAQKDKEEKNQRPKNSILDDVPLAFPSLLRAQKLSKKAAKVGFEWQNTDDVFSKILEEINELKVEMTTGDVEKQREELGDVLFSVVQLARRLHIDAEDSLRLANTKFYNRFSGMENDIRLNNKEFSELSAEDWDKLWNIQKSKSK
jgi:ATP diphosphatase